MSLEDEIRAVEEEIRRTPYNKATEHHIGVLRRKLSLLLKQVVKSSKRGGGSGFSVKKQGDATVVMVGLPSVGKSTLLSKLTSAESKSGDYAFTTLSVVPGMLEYNHAKIQFLDVPGIIEKASEGKGLGRRVLSVVRSADLLLLVVEAGNELDQLSIILNELRSAGVRVNERPPMVKIKKKSRGGLSVHLSKSCSLSLDVVRQVLLSLGLCNADIVISGSVTVNQLVDAVLGNRFYVPGLVAVNKVDKCDFVKSVDGFRVVGVSALTGRGLEELKRVVWEELGFLRVYLRKPGVKELGEPLIVRRPCTVEQVMRRLGLRGVPRVWGGSVKFNGQRVSLSHELVDGDVVSFT